MKVLIHLLPLQVPTLKIHRRNMDEVTADTTVLITDMRGSRIGTVWAACYLDFYLCPNLHPGN